MEKLTGTITGNTRQDLLMFATRAGEDYFQAPRDQIRISLRRVEALTVTERTHNGAIESAITGYEGDFTAEVIEP